MRTDLGAAAVLVALLAAPGLSAQNENVYVTLCRAHFTVMDRLGHFVTGLTRDDVTVFDDDAQQRIADFVPKRRSPVSVALLIDRSESVSDRFKVVSQAATTFVDAVIRDGDDRGLVVAFDSKVYLLQGWTSEREKLVDSIRTLTTAGGTSLFDSILKTCRDGFDAADPRQRVVVIITDGEDTTSRATFDQALEMATLSKVVVYVVGVRAERSLNTRELQGHRVLTTLADLTGGRVFYPDGTGLDQLAAVFGRVREELRNQYDISYYRQVPPDHSFHRIRVETRNKALTVHAPTGYFARRAR